MTWSVDEFTRSVPRPGPSSPSQADTPALRGPFALLDFSIKLAESSGEYWSGSEWLLKKLYHVSLPLSMAGRCQIQWVLYLLQTGYAEQGERLAPDNSCNSCLWKTILLVCKWSSSSKVLAVQTLPNIEDLLHPMALALQRPNYPTTWRSTLY